MVHTKWAFRCFWIITAFNPGSLLWKEKRNMYIIFMFQNPQALQDWKQRMKRPQPNPFVWPEGEKREACICLFLPIKGVFCMSLGVKLRIKKRRCTSALTRAKQFGWNCLCIVYEGLLALYHSRCSTSCSESPQLQVIEAHCTCSPQAHVHILLKERTHCGPLSCVLFISDTIWLTLQCNR